MHFLVSYDSLRCALGTNFVSSPNHAVALAAIDTCNCLFCRLESQQGSKEFHEVGLCFELHFELLKCGAYRIT